MTTRRTLLAGAGAVIAAPAVAQERFPSRPIRLFVPWTGGTSSDVQIRSTAEGAAAILGQPIVIENRPGAGGTLHCQALASAAPDGYTLGQMHLSVIRRPFMVRQPQWDAVRDYSHIIRLAGWMYGVAVRADSPWQNWEQFVAAMRAAPGTLSYATSGIGTTNHLAMEELLERVRGEMLHVPYRSSAEGVTGVLSRQVNSIADASSWKPMVEDRQMRALCVWTENRVPSLPDVPTLKELGHDMVVTSPYGLSGPRGMDPGRVKLIHDAFHTALMSEAHQRVLNQFDMPRQYLNTEQFADFVATRADYERAMVQRLNIRLD